MKFLSIDYKLLEAAANYSAADTMTSYRKQTIREGIMIDDRTNISCSNKQRRGSDGPLQNRNELEKHDR